MNAPQTPPVPFGAGGLSPAQIDGAACVRCGRSDGPMRPVGMLDGGQLFACTSHDQAPPVEQPGTRPDVSGVAGLAETLARLAGVPPLLVCVAEEWADNARAYRDPCTDAPRVDIGRELLDGAVWRGVLAHEVAHHALDHPRAWLFWRGRGSDVARGAFGVAVVAVAWGLPPVVVVAVAVVATVAVLGLAWRERREEYAADAMAVWLLDRAGLDGRRVVAGTLAGLPGDPWWYAAGVWLFASHPTSRARRRRLARLGAGVAR